jgi:O-antigen/teichoic acid export membrane protein
MSKNSLVYLFGDLANKFFPFLLLPIISRNFGSNALFEYSNVVLIYTFTSILFSVPFSSFLGTYFFKSRFGFKHGFGTFLYLNRLFIIPFSLFFFLSSLVFFVFFKNIIFIYVMVFFVSILSICQPVVLSLLQANGDSVKYIALASFRNVLFFILLFISWFFSRFSFDVLLLLFVFSCFISFFISYYCLLTLKGKYLVIERFSRGLFCKLISFGLPLLPSAILNPLRSVLDRVVLVFFLGGNFAGVYAGYFQISSVVLLLSASQVKSISPLLFNYLAAKDFVSFFNLIYRAIFYLFLTSLFISISVYYFGDSFLGSDFYGYEYFSLLPFFFFFQCAAGYLTCYYQFYNQTKLLMKYNIISLLHYILFIVIGASFSGLLFVLSMLVSALIFFIFSFYKVRCHYHAEVHK